MKNLKRYICCFMLVVVTVCCPMSAFADEKEAIMPMEMNDDALIAIAEELMVSLELKSKYSSLYYNSDEIDELVQIAKEVFGEQYSEAYVIPIDFENVIDTLAEDDFEEIAGLSKDEMQMVLDNRIGNTIISVINARIGTAYVAASSVMTTSRSYVADLDQEMMVILAYDNQLSIVADIYTSGEHVITAVETMMPTESIPLLLEKLSGIINEKG